MRTVAYCAAGAVMAFPIPNERYEAFVRRGSGEALDGDLRESCVVLERAVDRWRRDGAADASGDVVEAACRIWRFFNQDEESRDDIVIVDHVGDGMSVEFAPMAGLACSLAGEQCHCLKRMAVARPIAS